MSDHSFPRRASLSNQVSQVQDKLTYSSQFYSCTHLSYNYLLSVWVLQKFPVWVGKQMRKRDLFIRTYSFVSDQNPLLPSASQKETLLIPGFGQCQHHTELDAGTQMNPSWDSFSPFWFRFPPVWWSVLSTWCSLEWPGVSVAFLWLWNKAMTEATDGRKSLFLCAVPDRGL